MIRNVVRVLIVLCVFQAFTASFWSATAHTSIVPVVIWLAAAAAWVHVLEWLKKLAGESI